MSKLFAILTSAFAFVLLSAIAGAASLVAGIAVNFGWGWALIASGLLLLAGSWLVAKGMTRDE